MKAQANGDKFEDWKKKKIAEANDPTTAGLDSKLADEAWAAGLAETQAIEDAKTAIDRGDTIEDFEREAAKRDDPNRSLPDRIEDAARAWAEAVK